jgi:hypothetical protein
MHNRRSSSHCHVAPVLVTAELVDGMPTRGAVVVRIRHLSHCVGVSVKELVLSAAWGASYCPSKFRS